MKPEWLTADGGIAVEAPDLARLFERAAWGMFSVITDVAAARATETSRISIDAPDRVALLVHWLSELNYRHVTEHRIFSKFEVVTLSEQHLEADVSGEIFDNGAPHNFHRDYVAAFDLDEGVISRPAASATTSIAACRGSHASRSSRDCANSSTSSSATCPPASAPRVH